MLDKQEQLIQRFQEENIVISEEQANQLIRYYELLVDWNQRMNLTAITEFHEVMEKHFIDSCLIIKAYPDISYQTVIDIGTGAGFPGIPIKILKPECKLVLLDSLQKRIRFLDEVVKELKLTNVITIHGRAEELARRDEYREQYDLCVSRAVAKLVSLCELCIPFVKKGGYFIAYKAIKADEERKEAEYATRKLGGVEDEVKTYAINHDSLRSLIRIKKVNRTELIYPRGNGKPLSKPLIK